jgi:hypothetical protein
LVGGVGDVVMVGLHGSEAIFNLHPTGGEGGVYMRHGGQEGGDFGFEFV